MIERQAVALKRFNVTAIASCQSSYLHLQCRYNLALKSRSVYSHSFLNYALLLRGRFRSCRNLRGPVVSQQTTTILVSRTVDQPISTAHRELIGYRIEI